MICIEVVELRWIFVCLLYLFKISEWERFEDVVTPVGECQQRGLTFLGRGKGQLIEMGV